MRKRRTLSTPPDNSALLRGHYILLQDPTACKVFSAIKIGEAKWEIAQENLESVERLLRL